jgi:hypothetical protein
MFKHKVTVTVEFVVEAEDKDGAYDQAHYEAFKAVKPLDGYVMQIVVGESR